MYMKAVVLAAGEGKRLQPITYTHPKPLLPVGGQPILERILRDLKNAGITEVFLVVNYLEDKIKAYFKDGSQLGISIKYIHQPHPNGTGDALLYTEEYVGSEELFIMMYGDLVIEEGTIKQLLKFHKQVNADATIANIIVNDASQYAALEVDGWKVKKIIEKPKPGETTSKFANAGIYVLPSKIFDAIKETQLSSRNEIEITDSLQILINKGFNVATTTIKGFWMDVGRLWDWLDANSKLMQNIKREINGTVESGATLIGRVYVGKGAVVRSGSYIEGPVWISEGADIGPNNYIRPYTYIGKKVRIGNACEIKNSIILDNTHIAHLSYVGDSIIGANVNFGAGTITANLRFDNMPVKVEVKGKLVDSGHRKLGAFVGDNVKTGIGVLLMPGIKIGPNSWIGPGVILNEDVPANTFVIVKQSIEFRKLIK